MGGGSAADGDLDHDSMSDDTEYRKNGAWEEKTFAVLYTLKRHYQFIDFNELCRYSLLLYIVDFVQLLPFVLVLDAVPWGPKTGMVLQSFVPYFRADAFLGGSSLGARGKEAALLIVGVAYLIAIFAAFYHIGRGFTTSKGAKPKVTGHIFLHISPV